MKTSLILGTLALSLLCPSFSWGQTNIQALVQVPQVDARILLNTQKPQHPSEETVLEITLENTGKTPLRFYYRDIQYFYQIEVTAPNRKVEALPGYTTEPPLGFFSQGITIPPQGKRKGYFYLSRAFDLSKEDLYTVTASKKSRQAEVEGIFTITSQPLEIRITKPSTFGYWEEHAPPAVPQPETPAANQPK